MANLKWPPPAQTLTNDAEESSKSKALIILVVAFTTIVSIFTQVGLERHWTIHGDWYDTVDKSRSTTQVVVQIVSGLLGGLQVYAVCQLFNFASRITLTRKPTSLDRLRVWNALSLPKIDWSTPSKTSLALLIFFYLAARGPSALWAGALTPTPTLYNTTNPVKVPWYSPVSYKFWSQNIFSADHNSLVNSKGTFSYQPTQHRLGYLVTDGSAASSIGGLPTQRQKNDNSNFTYLGRSYGIASSVGLTDDNMMDGNRTAAYQYSEIGYYPSVECIYNATTAFGLQLVQAGSLATGGWQLPFQYLATGPGPYTTITSPKCAARSWVDCGGYVVAGLGGDTSIVAAAWWASVESGLAYDGLPETSSYVNKIRPPRSKAIMSIASGSANVNLNRTQCSISVIPASFSVDVNVRERTISVTPQNDNGSNVVDFEPSGFIADSASSVLAVMSLADTTLLSSVLGIMLQSNIANLQLKNLTITQNSTMIGNNAVENSTLQGVAESLQVLIDGYLLATASAQLIIAQDFKTAPAIVSSRALSIGDRSYSLAVVTLNAVLLLACAIEAIRTRFWRGLPKFNYTDVKSVVIASFLGGANDTANKPSTQARKSKLDDAGAMKVILRPRREIMLLSLLDQDNLDEDSRPMLHAE